MDTQTTKVWEQLTREERKSVLGQYVRTRVITLVVVLVVATLVMSAKYFFALAGVIVGLWIWMVPVVLVALVGIVLLPTLNNVVVHNGLGIIKDR